MPQAPGIGQIRARTPSSRAQKCPFPQRIGRVDPERPEMLPRQSEPCPMNFVRSSRVSAAPRSRMPSAARAPDMNACRYSGGFDECQQSVPACTKSSAGEEAVYALGQAVPKAIIERWAMLTGREQLEFGLGEQRLGACEQGFARE